MPLTVIQREILKAISANRSAASYVAGGAALNRNRPRLSDDLDIFTDKADLIAEIAKRDIASLTTVGFRISGEINHYGLTVEAVVARDGVQSRIQWMDETRRRFFPIEPDDEFGMRLHDADLGVNKVLCACSRTEARDFIDLVEIHSSYCPLGALIWAATAKITLGPGKIIEEIRRRAGEITDDQYETVRTTGAPYERRRILSDLNSALDQAKRYVETAALPTMGSLLTTHNNVPVEANERMLADGAVNVRQLREFSDAVPEVTQ